jgi:hypothetical protein
MGCRDRQKPRLGKPLGREIYVASEASATPLQNYAPQTRMERRIAGSRPLTPMTQVLSTHASFSAFRTASNPGAERS